MDSARIPARSGLLLGLWRLSNATDRLAMFVVVLIVPTGLAGPVRWLTARPSRRIGFYVLGTALAVLWLR